MPIGHPPENDVWKQIMRVMGFLARVPIALGMILVSGFMLWWMLILIKAAGRFILRHFG